MHTSINVFTLFCKSVLSILKHLDVCSVVPLNTKDGQNKEDVGCFMRDVGFFLKI